jgi:hypothetical protein
MTAGTASWRARDVAAGAALALLFLAQAVAIWRTTSATFDEGNFLRLALDVVWSGRTDGFVVQGAAPLPILLAYTPAALVAGSGAVDASRFASLITVARVTYAALVGVPLMLVVYAWLARRRGRWAGLAGGALLALSPMIVAHASVATTDACLALTSLMTLGALAAYADRPSPRRSMLVALALGLALSSKYSAVFLFPVAALHLLPRSLVSAGTAGAAPPGDGGARVRFLWTTLLRPLAAWTVLAIVVVWALHLFAVAPLLSPTAAPREYESLVGTGPFATAGLRLGRHVPVPAPIKGLQRQWAHARIGHPSFLEGETSLHGWRGYFPLAFAMKSTPTELFLVPLVLLAMIVALRGGDSALGLWCWSIVVYGALAIGSSLDLGARYLLVLYPLFVLCAVDMLARWAQPRSHRVFGALTLVLVAAQAVSGVGIVPHDLSYFNRFFGGPAEGYRHLVDSNVDWGQDLPALRDAMARFGVRRVRLAYFGTAPPEAYGVSALPWDTPLDEEPGWLAVSATYLQGVYLPHDPFAGFRALRPDARAAYSIFLYDLRRPEAGHAFVRAIATRHDAASALKIAPAID